MVRLFNGGPYIRSREHGENKCLQESHDQLDNVHKERERNGYHHAARRAARAFAGVAEDENKTHQT